VNLRLRDSLQPAIDADVANALQVGQADLSFLLQKIIGVMRFEASMMDSFAFVALRRVRPPRIEAR
jgi:hypothetical protein